MEISSRFSIIFVILYQLLSLFNILQCNMETSETYSLAKNCKSMTFDDEYSRKLKLSINLTGALIRSHDDYLSDSTDNGLYPDNLSCELVAEAPVGSKIMLLIESLHIPTDNSLCDENYLYVFDYDSSRSKAMAAAGGEKGLCGRTYPKAPIITTGPYITIVFNSKVKGHKVPSDAGFLLTLTEIVPMNRNSPCQRDRYRCGPINTKDMHIQRYGRTPSDGAPWYSQNGITQLVTVARQTSSKVPKSLVVNYCIPLSLVCDGVKNCHDSSDEDSKSKTFCSDLQKVGIINRFLSLGLSASITIAVGCIIVITLCMGLTACYCVRLCTSGLHHRQAQLTKESNMGPEYQGLVIAPSVRGVSLDCYYPSNCIKQSSAYITIRDNSSASSCDTDKMHCPQNRGYMQISARPASERICHWGTSSLVSYPSNSEGPHSHPETPHLTRDPSKNNRSPLNNERIYRPSGPNSRCHHSSYSHHTPKSSRSGKSTRSTKSTNIDIKNVQVNESKSQMYPLAFDETNIRIMGSVLGQV